MENRYAAWKLGDYCERLGINPSDRMRLRTMGVPESVCLDFDDAVLQWKRFADRRLDEIEYVVDHSPERDPKVRMKPEALYKTMAEVLGLESRRDQAFDPITVNPDLVAAMMPGGLAL